MGRCILFTGSPIYNLVLPTLLKIFVCVLTVLMGWVGRGGGEGRLNGYLVTLHAVSVISKNLKWGGYVQMVGGGV